MPEKDTEKHVGLVERALKYVYDSVANSGAGETIQRRQRATKDAIAAMERGEEFDKQTTDSNNR